MPYVIGVVLAVVLAIFTRASGFDRDRVLYPTMLIVIALYYVLFAVMGAPVGVLVVETLVMAGFACFAVLGFRGNLWWVAAAIAGHGVFDFVRGPLIQNPGVPSWWPAFCGSIDVALGAWLGWLLLQRRIPPVGTDVKSRQQT